MHLDYLPGSFFGPTNLIDLLRHRAEHQANDIAFRFLTDGESEREEWTYGELDRRARSIAVALRDMGLEGERALLLFPAGLDFVAAFFGCLYAGVTAVPAYPPRRNRNMSRIEAIAIDANAKIALTTKPVLERVKAMVGDTPSLQKMVWRSTEQWLDTPASVWGMPDVHGDTLAFLQYTSGSTGTPKGVMLTHANLMHNSAMITYAFEHTRSGQGVFWLPLYHDMGLIGGILQPLYMGCPNSLISPTHFLQKPARWLQLISDTGATISGGPNFAYDLCVDKITDEMKSTLDLSNWALAFNGAEPVRPETMDRFSKAFESCGFKPEAFYPCYGLAEATLIVTGGFKRSKPVIRYIDSEALEQNLVVECLPEEDTAKEVVGSGGNLLDQEIVIADPKELKPCADNRIGEIWVTGPSVAQGYWNRKEATEETFQAYLEDGTGPFLRTGDLGFLCDGELFVTGRMKDLIIFHGVNHYPQDIEATVQKSDDELRPAAGAAFIFGKANNEKLVIVQEASRRRDLDYEAVIKRIRKAIATEHELPVDSVILLRAGSIPKTSSGKIQRHACKSGFLDKSLNAVARWSAKDGFEKIARVRRSLEVEGQDEDTEVAKSTPRKSKTESVTVVTPSPAALPDGSVSHTSPIAEIVFERIRAIAKERAGILTLETNILELGMDSLERMEIVATIEDAFGGRFPEEVLIELETCAEVVAAVEKYMGGGGGGGPAVATPLAPVEHRLVEGDYIFSKSPEYLQLQEIKKLPAKMNLPNPFFTAHQGVTNDRTMIEGREYINWCSYNYVGMSGDPVIAQAAKQAISKFGTSVSASRVVSGEKTIHVELERAISDFIGTEDSIVFVGGHTTNETTIGHLFGPGDLIMHDGLAHNSIVQGAILSGARRRPFPHNDFQACDKILEEIRGQFRRVLIVIEGVYSMDGDISDLPGFIKVKRKHKATLMVDEAHSLGTMGLHGRGMAEYYDLNPRDVDLWMGTLSKAFGSCGGFIAAEHAVIEYLKYTAPGFVYSVGLPPASVAAALASIQLLEEEPQRVATLSENSALFLKLAKEAGLDTGMSCGTPVIPIITGSSPDALLLSHKLFKRGINVQPIMHPAVEEKAARLRFFITSTHTKEQIEETVAAAAQELAAIRSNLRKSKQSMK